MKTQTRDRILKIIEEKGKVRPFELKTALNLSAQAIHRHLRKLVDEELIESKGSAPFTNYSLAGVPDLKAVANWMNSKAPLRDSNSLICETRDVFNARLPHIKSFVRNGLPESFLPLVISDTGEIGNNSFDHNLGQWRDVPGCWFEAQVTGRQLWICVADRGQGVYQSLFKIHPELQDEQSALKAAFETIISGRAPEQRGNGLKFVKNNLSTTPGRGIACMSGSADVFYGDQGRRCFNLLRKYFKEVRGTVTLMTWRFE